ncbi:MAG: SH3 domain-containing protein [Blautia sp.]|nr:SH3 domain-containing protein [Blautia sp.]
MMKKPALLGLAAAVFIAAGPVHAMTFISYDGVLSIQAPSDRWKVISDPLYWFAMSDGANVITINHLRNGETLSDPDVAGPSYAAVCQIYASTPNEVFVVRGAALKEEGLEEIMKALGTVKVLKYDTLSAVKEIQSSDAVYSMRAMSIQCHVKADLLNVRSGCSLDDAIIGSLSMGDIVNIISYVTKDGSDYGWCQIDYGGTVGYVGSEFLEVDSASGNAVEDYSYTWKQEGVPD